MKYLVLVPDGCADEPLAELDGRTPLEAAHMPHLARLAATAEVGRAEVIPPGLPPGSDVGNLSILGYDPAEYHTGRAPIEAAAMGVDLAPDEVAYRCNLVTLAPTAPATTRWSTSPPVTSPASRATRSWPRSTPRSATGATACASTPASSTATSAWCRATSATPSACRPTTSPVSAIVLPSGPAAAKLTALMDASKPVVAAAAAEVGSVATQIWLWGQGTRPQLPDFAGGYGVTGRLSSAVDLVRGLGVLSGIEVLDVPGATAGFDNDYVAQRDAALASLADRDFFLLHVEATDEAGHQGAIDEKVASLERWDADIIGPLVEALGDEPYRILLLPDHATPCAARTHTSDPVPYLLFATDETGAGGEYTERGVAGCRPVPAHDLMARLLR